MSGETIRSSDAELGYVGRERNRAWFKITTAVYNLIRITALDTRPA